MSKKLTHEEFLDRVLQKNKHYANNEFEIVGRYINYHQPVKCYCRKHDLYWEPTAASLCDGWGCPSCGTESTARHRRLSHDDFINKLLQSNEHYVNGEFVLKSQYVGSNKPITCYCIKHNLEWTTIPDHLYKGCGCPMCGKEIVAKKTELRFQDRTTNVKEKKILIANSVIKTMDADLSAEGQSLFHEAFLKKLLEKNTYYANGDFTVDSQYIKNNEPILCHCNIHNIDWLTTPSTLLKGHKCPNCGDESRAKNKRLTHESFLEKLLQLNKHYANGDFNIVGRYKGVYEPIECYCNIHNVSWYPLPINLCKGSGCHYCWGKRVIVGFNDMWTTRPDIASMLQDPEDGYRYTFCSNEKTWFNCPDCGTPSLKRIYNVAYHNFGCQHCSDNVSYPNKFGRALLDQLPINGYDYEYQPDWVKPYYYDNHFSHNNVEYILEMDGELHFKNQTLSRSTLEQIQKRDRLKDELAVQHNIHMIRIECMKSEMNYIKANILKSELNNIFDLSNINWEICDQKAQKNILKEACKLYMSNAYTLKQIGKILQVHPATISQYLKKGTKFGWCDYAPTRERAIVVIDDNCQIIHSYKSLSECAREMSKLYENKFYSGWISKCCKTHKPYHGFNFRFANEFNN